MESVNSFFEILYANLPSLIAPDQVVWIPKKKKECLRFNCIIMPLGELKASFPYNEESIDHLLFYCSMATGIWSWVLTL